MKFYEQLEQIESRVENIGHISCADKKRLIEKSFELQLIEEIHEEDDLSRVIEVEEYYGDGIYMVLWDIRRGLRRLAASLW